MRFFKPTCALLLYRCLKGIANSIQYRQFVKPRNCLLLLTRIKPRRSNECYQRRRVCCWGAGLELLVDIFCAMNISLGNQLLRQFNRHTQRGGIGLLFLPQPLKPTPPPNSPATPSVAGLALYASCRRCSAPWTSPTARKCATS